MKKLLLFLFIVACGNSLPDEGLPSPLQELNNIVLLKPDKTRGLSFMQTLDVRASTLEWSDQELNLQDLSDLVWAANGINRPLVGKRTASSAQNAQDIDIYVFMKEGVYLYDAPEHILKPLVIGDYKSLAGKTDAPVILVLISDISRFRAGYESFAMSWANIDCGIVSQNISLFCAATGLKTRPKAIFQEAADTIRQVLKLKNSQHILLHHPVGYAR